MLNSIKKHVLELKFKYHQKLADYYFTKVDEYDPIDNLYWMEKIKYHVRKESDIFGQILKMRET